MSSGLEVTNPNFEPYGYFSALTKSDTTATLVLGLK